jgi:hypothetical protein
MDTDMLIASLAREVKPVPRGSVGRRIAIGIGGGAAITVAIVGLWLGFRDNWMTVIANYHFWVKWLYTVSLGVGAIVATSRLARPDPRPSPYLWLLLAAPVVLLAIIGVAEMMQVPSSDWLAMWLGSSWRHCSRNVLILALPIFAGLLWSFRRLAPARLRVAGAAAGLAAGAFGAALYCLHCPEVSAIFVLTWYTLGIGAMTLLGALLGPKLLRW